MKYITVKTGTFLSRPNRFIAQVLVDDKVEIVHVKNTGRCKEILLEGAKVILEEATNVNRKTKYSLVAVYKENVLINIDSQIPNMVVYEGIQEEKIKELNNITKLSREVVYGNSRFDLYFESGEQKGFIEVKGVTLEAEGVAMFPDAPTERGCKHIYEMIKAVEEGYSGFIFSDPDEGYQVFYSKCDKRDPKLAAALKLASEKGVGILAYDAEIYVDGISIGNPVNVHME